MGTAKILSEEPISVYELKEDIEKIKRRDKELNYRATRTEEYINHVATNKKQKEIYEKIQKLNIPRIKESHIKKIIDINPKSITDLKVAFQGYTISLTNENIKKIIDIFNESP